MEAMTGKNLKIGDMLKEQGYLSDEDLQKALEVQKKEKGKRLGEVLIEQGYITESQMLEAMAVKMDCEVINVSSLTVDIEAVEKIPRQVAEKYCVLPVGMLGNSLQVIVNDPLNFYGLEDVRQITGMELTIFLSEKAPLLKAIHFYYAEVSAKEAANKANEATETQNVEEMEVEEGDDDTPIINLLNSLIQRAYSTNASDIHIEPFEDKTSVRMRIDGTIVEYVTLKTNVHNSLIARIKILAELDIAERRAPQDGHFKVRQPEGYLNIRVSVIPTVFGEKAVLRLLAGNARIDNSNQFGMLDEDYQKLLRMLRSPNGIIYLTGPTGSGKTTTLYMILEELAKRNVNISTIEDPVEKNLPRVNQMQVNPLAGLTFETGLRALLRQDPDIIMVGETRDSETASISVRSALTGHLVFSTLHTNDAASSAVRLKDMGLEPYLIANSLVGVVAQRLMRKVCQECCEERELTEEDENLIGVNVADGTLPRMVKKACGCPVCNNTGYRGRIAVHEIMTIDKEVRRMITENVQVEEIKEYLLKKQGMKTLKQSALYYLRNGITTVEEVMKVAYYEE
ncbi:MAG: Flp pilus assembly complex ATPase component TadA [Lachnospiraceae bacterium]|nr:Flp pilus assembly complex ATPase component TadA [Lachnospiraceae bacterium]